MVSQKIKIMNPTGLHLRPAGNLCKEAMKFKSLITFEYRNNVANAKSVLSVLDAGFRRIRDAVLRSIDVDVIVACSVHLGEVNVLAHISHLSYCLVSSAKVRHFVNIRRMFYRNILAKEAKCFLFASCFFRFAYLLLFLLQPSACFLSAGFSRARIIYNV